MISFSINNITRSRKTTIGGIILGIAALVSVFTDSGTWAEVSPMLLLSIYLLGSKDPGKKEEKDV